MSKWFVDANGAYFGEYSAASEADALEEYADDAGYESFGEMPKGGDVYAYEIDVEALFSEVAKAAGTAVFQDAYGEGVALIDGRSFKSLKELAEAHGLEIRDFTL